MMSALEEGGDYQKGSQEKGRLRESIHVKGVGVKKSANFENVIYGSS